VSVTCEVSLPRGIEWFLTKGSRLLPARRVSERSHVKARDLSNERYVHGVFYLKIYGAVGECELLVATLATSTLEWAMEEIVGEVLTCLQQTTWVGVSALCEFLTSQPRCGNGCRRLCDSVLHELWRELGWRRVYETERSIASSVVGA
jgi:hypothetical protein